MEVVLNSINDKPNILMAVKHIPTGEVHRGYKGRTTGCGFDTKVQPSHWEKTTEKVTCDRIGCKN